MKSLRHFVLIFAILYQLDVRCAEMVTTNSVVNDIFKPFVNNFVKLMEEWKPLFLTFDTNMHVNFVRDTYYDVIYTASKDYFSLNPQKVSEVAADGIVSAYEKLTPLAFAQAYALTIARQMYAFNKLSIDNAISFSEKYALAAQNEIINIDKNEGPGYKFHALSNGFVKFLHDLGLFEGQMIVNIAENWANALKTYAEDNPIAVWRWP